VKEFEGSVTAQNKFAEGDRVLKYSFSPILNKLDPHRVCGYIVTSKARIRGIYYRKERDRVRG
ncbi:hypothetical protein THOM_1156, partial [Trachipleistophora hominis]